VRREKGKESTSRGASERQDQGTRMVFAESGRGQAPRRNGDSGFCAAVDKGQRDQFS
jgi:hypothetical protein